jgi:hypothetical protein
MQNLWWRASVSTPAFQVTVPASLTIFQWPKPTPVVAVECRRYVV